MIVKPLIPYCPRCDGICYPRMIKDVKVFDCQGKCKEQIADSAIIWRRD